MNCALYFLAADSRGQRLQRSASASPSFHFAYRSRNAVDYRMIEGHVQHLIEGHLLLMHLGQQVSNMLDFLPDPLDAKLKASALFDADEQDAIIAQHRS